MSIEENILRWKRNYNNLYHFFNPIKIMSKNR